MKRVFISSCVVVVLAGVGFAWLNGRVPSVAAQEKMTTTARSTQPTISVDDLMKNVDQYRGVIEVEGVTSAVSTQNQQVFLIDRREMEECGKASCATYVLPVRWAGVMPAVKDVVRIKGEVQDAGNGKLVFAAVAVEGDKSTVKGKKESKGK